MTYEDVKMQAEKAVKELLEKSHVKPGDIFIVGCSTSEIAGSSIGQGSNEELARAVYDGIKPILDDAGLFLAAQCCEHLNRAVVIEEDALRPCQEMVNAVPQLHAGGAFAVTVYNNAKSPVLVEEVKASAGMDIGDTLIGMQLKHVAVPVRIDTKEIGFAHLVCARTRPKFVGGERAVYDEHLSGGDIPR